MTLSAVSAAPVRMRLPDLPLGVAARVFALEGEAAFCARLREMGFCETAVIERISGASTLLCQVCNSRIALSGRAAQNILVEPIRRAI